MELRFTNELENACFEKWQSDSKIGILASISPDGYTHPALITSIMAKTKTKIMWGQFSRGPSKDNLLTNPKTGFAVVGTDMYWWTGKALHGEVVLKGDDYELYNNKPLFRYNSYFGIGAIHYEDIIDISAAEKLPIAKFVLGACAGKIAASSIKKTKTEIIPPFGMNLLSKIDTLKFVSFIDDDGFPRIISALQIVPVDTTKLFIPFSVYKNELEKIKPSAKVSVYLCTMKLTNILLQGIIEKPKKYLGTYGAILNIEKVYNSMLPVGKYIYPPQEIKNVFCPA
jgi:hypothetical protein